MTEEPKKRVCDKCNKEYGSSNNFCIECGSPLHDKNDENVVVEETVGIVQEVPTPTEAPISEPASAPAAAPDAEPIPAAMPVMLPVMPAANVAPAPRPASPIMPVPPKKSGEEHHRTVVTVLLSCILATALVIMFTMFGIAAQLSAIAVGSVIGEVHGGTSISNTQYDDEDEYSFQDWLDELEKSYPVPSAPKSPTPSIKSLS